MFPSSRSSRQGGSGAALLLIAVLCACSAAPALKAQSVALIRGRVSDAETGAPLEFVNVFLAGTTRGAGTTEKGTFTLPDIPPGFYTLVASRVGYEVAVVPVQLGEGDTLRRNFSLVARVVRTSEVEVVAGDPSRWRRDLEQFTAQFLGSDQSAKLCAIQNPEVIGFHADSATGVVATTADSVVRVRNEALGYRLYVNLLEFVMRRDANAVATTMYIRFEQMRPKSQADSLRWMVNRAEAYTGSRLHFLRSLVRGKVESEGFFIFDADGKQIGPDGRGLVFDAESGYKRLAHEGILRIEYRGSDRVRLNYVRFAMGIVHVHPDGNLVEKQEFIIDPASDWARERLSLMVPLDYRIP